MANEDLAGCGGHRIGEFPLEHPLIRDGLRAVDHERAPLERRPSGRPAPGGERPVERFRIVEQAF